jgi:hypothetical protein
VRELIRHEFDVRLSEISVGLLHKLGLNPQRLVRCKTQPIQRVRTCPELFFSVAVIVVDAVLSGAE